MGDALDELPARREAADPSDRGEAWPPQLAPNGPRAGHEALAPMLSEDPGALAELPPPEFAPQAMPALDDEQATPDGSADPEPIDPAVMGAPAASLPDEYDRLLATYADGILAEMRRIWSPPRQKLRIVGTGAGLPKDYYGDGTDGDVSVSGTVTLTRDMFYRNLKVTSTGRIKTAGFRIFVLQKLTIESGGQIDANGEPGANGSSASGGAGGAGGGGTSAAAFLARGGTGGNGGSSGGSGSAAGTAGAGGTGLLTAQVGPQFASGCGGGGGGYYGNASGATDATAGTPVLGADGGAGFTPSGVSTDSLGGGGGGGGGGVVLIFAREIDSAGSLLARGGDGGAGTIGTSDQAGGGGGGGGGAVILYYTIASGGGLGTISAAGGNGGSPSGTGGSAGVEAFYQVNA